MADHPLAGRVRAVIRAQHDDLDVTEQRMFGSVGFLVGGNLACGASDKGLMVRVDRDEHDALLDLPGTGTMVMRGRPMPGWLRVSHEALEDDMAVADWVARGVAYAGSLPAK